MDTSRREFFKSIIPKSAQNKLPKMESSIVTIGHIAVFPVHSSIKIKLMETDFLVESLPEGLRLLEAGTNKNIKLSLSSSGLIQAHLTEIWPSTAVLSILTGEIYNI